jgi:glycogen debranching enzyme
LPNWDEASFNQETGTLTVNSVSLNSLYTLDAWCLAQIADILNRREDYEHYLSEYEEMKDLINRVLWDDKEGFYFDRHWDGRFSSKKAASNFYPLLARIPDRTMALQMNKHLLNPKEFWGDFIIPTISRDDPAFNRDHFSWRGAIWAPTNYLVYQGLKAYRFDAVASEFAKRSYEIFLRTWENYQLCPESFDARTGASRGHEFLSWGPLFTLIALEEYLDFTPWEGFRFGMINPEEKGKLSRMSILGRHYEVDVSRALVRLKEEDREILRTNGSAVFRRFLYSENEISFEIRAIERRDIRIQFLVEGKYQVLVDDEVVSLPKGRSCRIRVPEGDHVVLIQLLERVD